MLAEIEPNYFNIFKALMRFNNEQQEINKWDEETKLSQKIVVVCSQILKVTSSLYIIYSLSNKQHSSLMIKTTCIIRGPLLA